MKNDSFFAGLAEDDICRFYDLFIGSTKNEEAATRTQIDILQEECAELIKALSKYKRVKAQDIICLGNENDALKSIIEEMTQVCLSMAIVSAALEISRDDILKELEKKVAKYNLNGIYGIRRAYENEEK